MSRDNVDSMAVDNVASGDLRLLSGRTRCAPGDALNHCADLASG
jgi:hypothetical protein